MTNSFFYNTIVDVVQPLQTCISNMNIIRFYLYTNAHFQRSFESEVIRFFKLVSIKPCYICDDVVLCPISGVSLSPLVQLMWLR